MKAPILAALLLLVQGQYAAALNPVRQQDVQHECPLSKTGNNQLSSIVSKHTTSQAIATHQKMYVAFSLFRYIPRRLHEQWWLFPWTLGNWW